MARDVLPAVNALLISSVRGILRILHRMIDLLMTSGSRTRVHADIVVITLNDHFVCALSLVVPMPFVMIVVMVVMPRVRRTTAKMVVLLRRTHIISSKVPLMMMVVVMMMMTRFGLRKPSADVNIIVVSLDNQDVVRVLRAMMIVVITVMMVVVAVTGIREGGRRTTTESNVAVHPVDMNVRSRPRFFLRRLLCWHSGRGGIPMRLMGFVMRRITPR